MVDSCSDQVLDVETVQSPTAHEDFLLGRPGGAGRGRDRLSPLLKHDVGADGATSLPQDRAAVRAVRDPVARVGLRLGVARLVVDALSHLRGLDLVDPDPARQDHDPLGGGPVGAGDGHPADPVVDPVEALPERADRIAVQVLRLPPDFTVGSGLAVGDHELDLGVVQEAADHDDPRVVQSRPLLGVAVDGGAPTVDLVAAVHERAVGAPVGGAVVGGPHAAAADRIADGLAVEFAVQDPDVVVVVGPTGVEVLGVAVRVDPEALVQLGVVRLLRADPTGDLVVLHESELGPLVDLGETAGLRGVGQARTQLEVVRVIGPQFSPGGEDLPGHGLTRVEPAGLDPAVDADHGRVGTGRLVAQELQDLRVVPGRVRQVAGSQRLALGGEQPVAGPEVAALGLLDSELVVVGHGSCLLS